MHRLITRLVVAALATTALLVGQVSSEAVAAVPRTTVTALADTPCEQAIAAYDAAHDKYVTWKHKLRRARRLLHQAHAHGTAAQFQRAKNRVRHAKGQVFKYKTEMNEALAQEAAVC